MVREMKRGKTLDERVAEMNRETPVEQNEVVKQPSAQEIIKTHAITHIPASEVEKNYQPKTVGIRVDIKKDLNKEIDRLCIELEVNKKDLIESWISEGVKKEKKKLEK